MSGSAKPRKRLLASGEFWLGVVTVFVCLTLLVAFGQRLFGN